MPLYFPTASSSSGEGASVEGRREERKSKHAGGTRRQSHAGGERKGKVDGEVWMEASTGSFSDRPPPILSFCPSPPCPIRLSSPPSDSAPPSPWRGL